MANTQSVSALVWLLTKYFNGDSFLSEHPLGLKELAIPSLMTKFWGKNIVLENL